MKFASGFEILEYCQAMAERSGFYDHCLFHTTVQQTVWDEATGHWMVATDRGDRMRARYVVLANGILTTPKLARIEGMETFKGKAFHTSRWDYNVDLEGKRVGIIGTGATAVQVIPEIAKLVSELYVFQRTPSTIDVRDQRTTTQEEIDAWSKEPGWARAGGNGSPGFHPDAPRLKPTTTIFRARSPISGSAGHYERELSPEELMEKQLNTQLSDHGTNPRPGRCYRQGSENRRGAETVLRLWMQAADIPR